MKHKDIVSLFDLLMCSLNVLFSQNKWWRFCQEWKKGTKYLEKYWRHYVFQVNNACDIPFKFYDKQFSSF